jgi:hypothetical protein
MIVLEDKSLTKLVDKQFEMIGEKMTFAQIPEGGVVSYMVGKKQKSDYWWNVYKFTEEQEEQWRKYLWDKLVDFTADDTHREEVFRHIDQNYGFVVRYKKEGELF